MVICFRQISSRAIKVSDVIFLARTLALEAPRRASFVLLRDMAMKSFGMQAHRAGIKSRWAQRRMQGRVSFEARVGLL